MTIRLKRTIVYEFDTEEEAIRHLKSMWLAPNGHETGWKGKPMSTTWVDGVESPGYGTYDGHVSKELGGAIHRRDPSVHV